MLSEVRAVSEAGHRLADVIVAAVVNTRGSIVRKKTSYDRGTITHRLSSILNIVKVSAPSRAGGKHTDLYEKFIKRP